MLVTQRRGFTLIELLVVIAIIGILAAMLFPVFARARESARKIQCLANVKNIAMAVQMYTTDYDALPPAETRQDVHDYFQSGAGGRVGGGASCYSMGQRWDTRGNPYLRWPVVFDEYIKNRDVWRCPSARMYGGATFINPGVDWLAYLQAHEGEWGGGWNGMPGVCYFSWPNGWGGAVTDSMTQGVLAIDQSAVGGAPSAQGDNAFIQSIGCNTLDHYGMSMSRANDASNFPIVGESGVENEAMSLGQFAYPDTCCMECTGLWGWPPAPEDYCGGCGDCYTMHANQKDHQDPSYAARGTRHLGGINVGFLDGHAQWFRSEAFLARMAEGKLEGIRNFCPQYTTREGYAETCGDPNDPGIYFLY